MNRSTQLEELDSLKSIFYSEEFQIFRNSDTTDKLQAVFWAFLTLPDNFTVIYLKSLDSPQPSHLKVKHLPPIELRLTLPDDYPSDNPPEFIICCKWLHKSMISLLCKKLDIIWSETGPGEIIYSWCDFLKNDSLSYLSCENKLDITELCLKHLSHLEKLNKDEERKKKWKERNGFRINNAKDETNNESNPSNSTYEVDNAKKFRNTYVRKQRRYPYFKNKNKISSPQNSSVFDERAVLNLNLRTSPIKIIENYNIEREKVEFSKNFYTCKICFCDKLGKDCTQFKDCNHVFCIDCIRSYFTVRIEDGTVQCIKCPEQNCTSEAIPPQVKEIVSEEMFAKYDAVLLRTALDTLKDIIYCPRQICQYPVSWEPEEKMASCPNCQFVFCVTCKMVYHGVEPCQIKGDIKKLVEEYENAPSDVRQQMESRYGKKHLQSLVNNTKAEAWIKENSKACPSCNAAIEKSQGCNKMVCWKCNASFCWLCCEILDPENPYLHFNDPQSRCANKLFHLVHDSDEEDIDWVYDSDSDSDFDLDYYLVFELDVDF